MSPHEISRGSHRDGDLARKLAREQALTEQVLDSLDDVYYVFTVEGEILRWNKRVVEVTGYTDEEIERMHPVQFVPEDQQALIEAKMAQTIEEGRVRFEASFLTKDGREIPFEFTGSLLEIGEELLICGIGRDITERKRKEQALRESEEKFRTLAERALVGVVLIQDGNYRYVNPRFADILGYDRKQLVGRPAEWIAHPGDKGRVKENVRKRLEGEREAIRYSFRARRKDGQTAYLEVYGARIRYQGRPAIIGSAVDVTEKRRLQREILQIQEAERRKMGRDLHDWIGSQLTGVTLMLQGLIGEVEAGGRAELNELREIATLVRESTSDARRLARGLNPGKLDPEGLPAALRNLADMSDQGVGPSCSYRQKGSPEPLSEEVAAHVYWIAQEAMNNARKYAEADQIRLTLQREDGDLLLTVADDGKGFAKSSQGSEGLGLRTMRYRAELLGGILEIDSSPGEGTTIRCRIPRP